MGGPNHFKTTINLKTNCKFVNTYCSVEDNYTAFPTNNVCLLVIFNSKTRYPKGAVQQMEVEIAALYNTMHINLQCTDRSRVGAEAMDLNMATDSYVQLSVTAFNFKIYICYDSSCPLFFHFLPGVLQSSIPNLAFSHHRYLQTHHRQHRLDRAGHRHLPCCSSYLRTDRSCLSPHPSRPPSLSSC